MGILFIQTGGTIDKDYPRAVKAYAFEITEPAIINIIERIHPGFTYKVISLMRKDSGDITDTDRKKILTYCKNTKFKKIIITHGTDTIIQTAQILSEIKDKIIILTGAFKPEKFKNSDADFNAGFAIGALDHAPDGIYIALQGRLFSAGNVCRKKDGEFTEKKKNDR
jgi:L-asparaginase